MGICVELFDFIDPYCPEELLSVEKGKFLPAPKGFPSLKSGSWLISVKEMPLASVTLLDSKGSYLKAEVEASCSSWQTHHVAAA